MGVFKTYYNQWNIIGKDRKGRGHGFISSTVPAIMEELRIYKTSLHTHTHTHTHTHIYIYIYIYIYIHIIKSKVHPRTGHKGPKGEKRYISTLSLTSALDTGGWLTPRPGRFTPRESPGTHCIGRLGGPQGRSGPVRKILPPPGFDPWTV